MNNPTLAVDPPKKVKFRSSAYNPEQLALLLESAKDTPLQLPILLASACGLRRGECCGLRWQDVDLEHGLLFVRNSLSYSGAGPAQLLPVKTQKSERSVRLPDSVSDSLIATQVQQATEKLKAGPLYHKFGYVWAFDDGTPHDPSNLSHRFLSFLRDNNLPIIRFHDLRHTHATLLLMEHVPVKTISERLGHSSTLITQDLYSHILPEMQKEAANAMNRVIAMTPPQRPSEAAQSVGEVVKFQQSKLPKGKKSKRGKKSEAKKTTTKIDQENKRIQKSS